MLTKTSIRTKFITSIIISLCCGNILAQDIDPFFTTDTIPQQELSEVVVTASRYGTIQLKTPEPVRTLSNNSIKTFQTRTAAESLTLTPGVYVQKTNHGGGSPFVRGLTGNQTLMLIDGIRLSNSIMRYGPNQYFNTIDVFSVGKIEVLRGSGSVQYGSDAIGGTIQAFSHELSTSGEPLWKSSLLTRFATHNMEQTLHGNVNYSSGKGAVRGGVAWRNFGDLVGGDTTGRQTPTGYLELDFDLRGKFLISPKSTVTLAYQNVHQGDVPVYHKVALENYAINKMDPQNRELAYLRLNRELGPGLLKSAVVTASYQHGLETRELLKNGSSSLRRESDDIKTMGFSTEFLTSSGQTWSANSGLEIYKDFVKSNRIDSDITTGESVYKRGLYPDGSSMTSLALFSMHTIDLDRWVLTAGARFNTFAISVRDEYEGRVKLKPSALVGNLALMRKLTSYSSLFASANTGFRAPNIDDLGTLGIVDFRYETPNYDLKPEHSFQYQAGYKYIGPYLRGELYVYRNNLSDLIVRNRVPGDTIEGYPVYIKENVERAFITGVETAWELVVRRSLTFSGNLTYTYGQNMTKNEPVRRIPPLFGRLAAEYSPNKWKFNMEMLSAAKQSRLAAGDVDDNRIPEGGTPGWIVFNAGTGYSFRFIEADLSILNLFNQDYRFHGSGVNGYGRSFFITFTLNI